MSDENHKSILELTLEDLGFRKYVTGENLDGAEDLIHRWYKEGNQWKTDYYIKRK